MKEDTLLFMKCYTSEVIQVNPELSLAHNTKT